jgi:hypothetical protein
MTMAITIPGRILRFLEHRANLAFAGTRSPQRVPYGHRVTGWIPDGSATLLTALIPQLFTDNLIEFLQDNGEFALTVEEFPSHETYQFKGRYIEHRSVQREDLVVVDRIRDRFVKSVRPIYGEAVEPILTAYLQAPAVAVTFNVHEIFLQTPGPGAGARLAPPAEVAQV